MIFYVHSLFRRFVLTKLRVIPKGAFSGFGDLEKMYVPKECGGALNGYRQQSQITSSMILYA